MAKHKNEEGNRYAEHVDLYIWPRATIQGALNVTDLEPKERHLARQREKVVIPVCSNEAPIPVKSVCDAVDCEQ